MLIIKNRYNKKRSLVDSQALLVNHAEELNARTQKYTAHEHKVASNLYRIGSHAINPKLHGYK